VSKSKGREYHDVSDPLEIKNEQENGRTTILVILLRLKNEQENGRTTILVIFLKLKMNRRMGGPRY